MSLVTQLNLLSEVIVEQGFAGKLESEVSSRIAYSTDNSIYQLEPAMIVIPETSADVAALVRANNSLKEPFGLVARGGGTGTNGQSLTTEVVVDFRRSMNRIVSVDAQSRTAIVEPGVVLGELNNELAPSGLMFAPHTSTSSRATIGGMVATDASGKGSLVYGRTNKHVLAIESVLFNGSSVRFTKPGHQSKLPEKDLAPASLVASVGATISNADIGSLPNLERGFSGYNLAEAAGELVDFTKLLCGAEGTLGLVTAIEINLVPIETKSQTFVASFGSFQEAVEASVVLRTLEPRVIEALDERTLKLAATSVSARRLSRNLNLENSALLILEFDAEVTGVQERLSEVVSNVVELDSAELVTELWRLRADAVGFLAKPTSSGAAVAFIEDCSVPPASMGHFVKQFTKLLDRYDLSYGMFGHADVGCIHVRPVLDLRESKDVQLVRTLSNEVSALVSSFGGVLWGEHGRGFRGEYHGISDELHKSMREIKTAFDPSNIFNPRKLYAPFQVDEELLRIDAVPLRGETNKQISEADFSSALDCNGNGICHSWSATDAMCPSYKVTLDPRLSPKGRADLVRSWLADPTDGLLADELASSMHQCLSCTACTTQCPVNVDMGELKSNFFSRYDGLGLRHKLRNRILSDFEQLGSKSAMRPLLNLGKPAGAVALGLVDLPKIKAAPTQLKGLERVNGKTQACTADVIIASDFFTTYLDPSVLAAAIEFLQSAGKQVAVTKFLPSAKFDHVKGRRSKFAKGVVAQSELIQVLQRLDKPVVGLEPSIVSLYSNEYVKADPNFPSEVVQDLGDYLANERIHVNASGSGSLFRHCSQGHQSRSSYQDLLAGAGVNVDVHALTCCGMAGIFGHEQENAEMSHSLFSQYWQPVIEESTGQLLAEGYSCRTQMRRFGYKPMHPIELLAAQIA